LSRYNNKIDAWKQLIDEEPSKRGECEQDMSDYIIKCMPYMKQYTEDVDIEVSTDNVFNCKVTSGLQRKDIFNEYLSDVENITVDKKIIKKSDKCETC
jgi:hypothetical protein